MRYLVAFLRCRPIIKYIKKNEAFRVKIIKHAYERSLKLNLKCHDMKKFIDKCSSVVSSLFKVISEFQKSNTEMLESTDINNISNEEANNILRELNISHGKVEDLTCKKNFLKLYRENPLDLYHGIKMHNVDYESINVVYIACIRQIFTSLMAERELNEVFEKEDLSSLEKKFLSLTKQLPLSSPKIAKKISSPKITKKVSEPITDYNYMNVIELFLKGGADKPSINKVSLNLSSAFKNLAKLSISFLSKEDQKQYSLKDFGKESAIEWHNSETLGRIEQLFNQLVSELPNSIKKFKESAIE